MAPVSLLDLPRELHLHIFEMISDSACLAALCRVCKCLRQIAEPALYSSIQMDWSVDSLKPPIQLLLRSFLDRPDLANRVRSLILQGIGSDPCYKGERPKLDILPLSIAFPTEQLERAANSVGLLPETTQVWCEKVQQCDPDAVVALVIAMSLGLTGLFMDRNWLRTTRFLGHIIKAAVDKQREEHLVPQNTIRNKHTLLESLRHVSLRQCERWGVHTSRNKDDVDDILYLFYLPNLEHISTPIYNPVRFSWPLSTSPNLSTLTTLELTKVRECFLGDILSSPSLNNLQRLRYNMFYWEDVDKHASSSIIDLDSMVTAFLMHRKTLTELVIEGETQMSRTAIENPVVFFRGSLVSLSKLHRLKVLEVPWNFVTGTNEIAPTGTIASILPGDLEHLTLGWDISTPDNYVVEWGDEECISYLRSELESGALASFTKLGGICFMGSTSFHGLRAEHAAELEDLSRRFNLTLSQTGHGDMDSICYDCSPKYRSSGQLRGRWPAWWPSAPNRGGQ